MPRIVKPTDQPARLEEYAQLPITDDADYIRGHLLKLARELKNQPEPNCRFRKIQSAYAEEQFYRIKQALIQTGDFEETDRSDIKLLFRYAVELDILPFGAIENEHREIRLARRQPVVLDMHGFREVYPFVQEHALPAGILLKVCSLEGLVLLKLFANADDPSRTKDITDIEQLVAVYFDLDADEIY